MSYRALIAAFIASLFTLSITSLRADDEVIAGDASAPAAAAPADSNDASGADADKVAAVEPAAEAPEAPVAPPPPVKKAASKGRVERADSFVAPADWEFDGYVAGGTDQESKSMFYLNDLVYLNVGTEQGFDTGVRVEFFKRGQKVRDPRTGKMLGYEVRRTAVGQVTDHVDKNTCAVRVLKGNEAIEIGDFVRKEN